MRVCTHSSQQRPTNKIQLCNCSVFAMIQGVHQAGKRGSRHGCGLPAHLLVAMVVAL